jgi:hypothetical protein
VTAGVTVEDSRHTSGAGFPQNGAGIVFGIAGVDDEWEIYFRRERDLGRKNLPLHLARRVVIMIIEAALADRDGASSQQRSEFGQVSSRIECRGVVRVDARRCEDKTRILRSIGRGVSASCKRFPDADYGRRARVAGAGNYLVAVAGERRVREVGVAVDEDRRASVLRGHLRSIQRRTGEAT